MKKTIKLGLFVGALCGLSNLNADVPHVFEDGDIIRAEEMNENFASVDAQIQAVKTDVENNSNNNSSWSEDYTYSIKDLTPGRDRVSVLEKTYDIMQFDTVSFNDHSAYTIKLPIAIENCYSYSSDYYPNCEALDSHGSASVRTYERRNYQDNHYGFSNTISGYPANISVSVGNAHVTDTFFDKNMTRAEFDGATYTEYRFSRRYNSSTRSYDIPRIDLVYIDANPSRITDPAETSSYECAGDWIALTEVSSFKWNVSAATSDNDAITSIDDFASILDACKADESATMAENQRVNKYFAQTNISIYIQIELDPHTILSMGYSFDEAKFGDALGYSCTSSLLTDLQKQNCDATVAPFDRNFSDDFDAPAKLPVKLTREGYVNQLLTLLDHIVISGSNSEN